MIMGHATRIPPAPLMRITSAQLKALHVIGCRRGLDHLALRELAGVASLKDLSITQAAELIERWQMDDHKRDFKPPEPDRAKARDVIRLATQRQRSQIARLFEALGWDVEKATAFLKRRHSITDLAGGVFSSAAASQIILELEAIRRNETDSTATDGGFEGD